MDNQKMEYATGIEPAIIELQSIALPFGYAYMAESTTLEVDRF